MNKEKQIKQLKLAAEILETGHPWEYLVGGWWLPMPARGMNHIFDRLSLNLEIRLALATPPDGRPLHNPDNLTAEQVGAGWRLACVGEKQSPGYQHNFNFECGVEWLSGQNFEETVEQCNPTKTVRLPLSVPWPEPEPQTKTVELGPEDVPPGSVFKWPECSWVAIDLVCEKGLSTTKHSLIDWRSAKEGGGKINRSIPLTGKWNPDAWEPCEKIVTV